MLDDPDHIRISGADAQRRFGLSAADLKEIGQHCLEKESPYDQQEGIVVQYTLREIVALAKRKKSEAQLLEHYERYLSKEEKGARESLQAKIYGGSRLRDARKPYWYSAPSTDTVEGRESVKIGLASNIMICCVKGGVWLFSGSNAVFADLMHSFSDVANYSYRLIRLGGSAQKRDFSHPYGYAPIRYITADRSFVILGGLVLLSLSTVASSSGAMPQGGFLRTSRASWHPLQFFWRQWRLKGLL